MLKYAMPVYVQVVGVLSYCTHQRSFTAENMLHTTSVAYRTYLYHTDTAVPGYLYVVVQYSCTNPTVPDHQCKHPVPTGSIIPLLPGVIRDVTRHTTRRDQSRPHNSQMPPPSLHHRREQIQAYAQMENRRNVSGAPIPSWRILILLSIWLVQTQAWSIVQKQSIRDERRTMKQCPRIAPQRQQRSTFTLQAVNSDDASSKIESQQENEYQQHQRFTIRNCKYADLKEVSDIIVNSFYTDNLKSSPFAAVLKLGELNRLQQNFPYNDSERHVMLVATVNDDDDDNHSSSSSSSKRGQARKIVGFVDVDARPATRRIDPPRPYLSDLAIHPDYRRNGIATILIQTCEALVHSGSIRVSATTTTPSEDSSSFTMTDSLSQKRELFIRVERANTAAIQMYEKFDYQAISHSIFGVEDTTVLLHKHFHHD